MCQNPYKVCLFNCLNHGAARARRALQQNRMEKAEIHVDEEVPQEILQRSTFFCSVLIFNIVKFRRILSKFCFIRSWLKDGRMHSGRTKRHGKSSLPSAFRAGKPRGAHNLEDVQEYVTKFGLTLS